ncbi:unnamed protein product [Paramecium sonneborni]|uniref:Uncharacterized protein n=1 Tax=Paramecium sonneborni TaxID=65129 RepID=A0A8S1RTL0_9CILI|nr:unnamed protein product [Paramecium sonneborni]
MKQIKIQNSNKCKYVAQIKSSKAMMQQNRVLIQQGKRSKKNYPSSQSKKQQNMLLEIKFLELRKKFANAHFWLNIENSIFTLKIKELIQKKMLKDFSFNYIKIAGKIDNLKAKQGFSKALDLSQINIKLYNIVITQRILLMKREDNKKQQLQKKQMKRNHRKLKIHSKLQKVIQCQFVCMLFQPSTILSFLLETGKIQKIFKKQISIYQSFDTNKLSIEFQITQLEFENVNKIHQEKWKLNMQNLSKEKRNQDQQSTFKLQEKEKLRNKLAVQSFSFQMLIALNRIRSVDPSFLNFTISLQNLFHYCYSSTITNSSFILFETIQTNWKIYLIEKLIFNSFQYFLRLKKSLVRVLIKIKIYLYRTKLYQSFSFDFQIAEAENQQFFKFNHLNLTRTSDGNLDIISHFLRFLISNQYIFKLIDIIIEQIILIEKSIIEPDVPKIDPIKLVNQEELNNQRNSYPRAINSKISANRFITLSNYNKRTFHTRQKINQIKSLTLYTNSKFIVQGKIYYQATYFKIINLTNLHSEIVAMFLKIMMVKPNQFQLIWHFVLQ